MKKLRLLNMVFVCCFFGTMLQASDQKASGIPWWLPTTVTHAAGSIAREVTGQSKENLSEVAAKTVELCNQALEGRIEQLVDGTGDRLDILLDEMQEAAAHTVKEQLEPLGHTLIIDLAQNIAKACLISGTGILGAIFAYKHMMAYFDIKHAPTTLYARWHEQKLAQYKEYHSFGAAHFLLAKFKRVGLVDTHDEQQKQAQLAGAGVLTLAAAGVLCSYWIC